MLHIVDWRKWGKLKTIVLCVTIQDVKDCVKTYSYLYNIGATATQGYKETLSLLIFIFQND